MRVRSHFNPFSVYKTFEPLTLSDIFPQPENPLIIEIGSAGGKFLLNFCQRYPHYNVVGLEIRKILVNRVMEKITEEQLSNAHIFHANANTALAQLFAPEQAAKVFIFFPDPWIKKRHVKRRVVNATLVNDIYRILKPGGEVFIQSDVLDLALDIRSYFDAASGFANMFPGNGWTPDNYTGVLTEREGFCIEDNDPVYRLRYVKTP